MKSNFKVLKQSEDPEPFDIKIYKDIGEGICAAILDLNELNPISRIQNSSFLTVYVIKFNYL